MAFLSLIMVRKGGSSAPLTDWPWFRQDFLETRAAHHHFKVPSPNLNCGCGLLNLAHFLALLVTAQKWGRK